MTVRLGTAILGAALSLCISGCDGADGQIGGQGPAGADGRVGDTGPRGDRGPQGPLGDAGPPGPQGSDGVRGPEGPQGPAGQSPDTGSLPDIGSPVDCPDWSGPPGLGGPVDSDVTLELAQRWKDYRRAREQERMWEALDPERIRETYRIEQEWIDDGCVDVLQAVDVGRALFLRPFTLADGLGNGLADVPGSPAGDRPPPNMRRFQRGGFGGPDAVGCFNCHWKGGLGSGGDRADNSYFRGDGENLRTHDERNPLSLWGSGWVQIIGQEMTVELQSQADALLRRAVDENQPVTTDLIAKDVYFGVLMATPDGDGGATLDTGEVEGVDDDLVVKPFGWKGVSPTIREFVGGSLQLHFNLQAEELVAIADQLEHIDLGNGDNPIDPDNDGVDREITEGQMTAIVLFLATFDTPILLPPTDGNLLPLDPAEPAEQVIAPEFTDRWLRGAAVFEGLGCMSCHKPLMAVDNATFRTLAPLSQTVVEVDLGDIAARPHPARREGGAYLVPVFSDFKRHDMGELLASHTVERGVPREQYLTRRLWGLANTRPYLHDGSAVLFDEAIALHGGEAAFASQGFADLTADDKSALRVFLLGLRRAPAIRIR